MAGRWIRFSTSSGSADRPFHAGITVDLLRGNLSTLDAECAVDISCHPPDGDVTAWSTVSSDGWTWLSTWDPLDVPVRPAAGGGRRAWVVECDGMLSTSGTVLLRAYLHPNGSLPAAPTDYLDPSDGFTDYTGYAEIHFTSTTWHRASGEIEIDGVEVARWPVADVYPSTATDLRPAVDFAFLTFATYLSTAGLYTPMHFWLRDVRIRESTT